MKHGRVPPNQGIQAESVTGDVIAVGAGAQAKKIVTGVPADELVSALLDLRRGIAALTIDEEHKRLVDREVGGMIRSAGAHLPTESRGSQQGNPPESQGSKTTGGFVESLRRIGAGLSAAGVVARETMSLARPIGQIAALLGTSAAALGF